MTKSAQDVFDSWALDHHADGMERDHRRSVDPAFAHLQPHGDRYLEVGVGNGYGLRAMASGPFAEGHCTGVDVAPNMVETARANLAQFNNIDLHVADFMVWETEDRFDLIFSMETFYYFASIQAGINRAAGLLAAGGTLAVLVNLFEENQASHGWSDLLGTPMQMWSAERYKEGFEKAGLVDIEVHFFPIKGHEEPFMREKGTLGVFGKRA